MKKVAVAMALALAWVLSARGPVLAAESEAKGNAALATALKEAKVSLEKGLAASQHEGKPISAKFEVEDGKLQLSVYTMKAGKFSEVVLDHKTGKVSKTEAITGGEDLTAAKEQGEAMAKAKLSLVAATKRALKANPGFRAVSVAPALEDGHPMAAVTLVKGQELQTVSEKLD